MRQLDPEQAAVARQQIEVGHELRTKLEAHWEGCEAWADSQLEGSSTTTAREAKSGLPANLQKEIVQEIETLLGRQPSFDPVTTRCSPSAFAPLRDD